MKRLTLIFAVVSMFLWSGKVLAQDSGMFIKKNVTGDFEQIVEKVKQEFKQVGFGVITEIDMDQKLEEKLDVDLKPYKILGVCNPGFAYKALQAEPNIGVFLPCKVIIRQMDGNNVEVVSSDPAMLMRMLNNEELNKLADEVSVKIKKAIENI
jgi:uncharacterized protein (DUF302 family)